MRRKKRSFEEPSQNLKLSRHLSISEMDIKNSKDLLKIISLLRKQGVVSFKSGDFQIELAKEALFPESPYLKKKNESSGDAVQVDTPYSEQDYLFWSSAGIPQLPEEVQ